QASYRPTDSLPTEAPLDPGTAAPLPPAAPLSDSSAPTLMPGESTDLGTAIPPPPAAEDDKSFDPNRTVNPRAQMDKTIVEAALSDSPDATVAASATFNASLTAPVKTAGATEAEGGTRAEGGSSKTSRKRTGVPLEDSLVIQPRGVRRKAGEPGTIYDYDVSKLIGEGGMGMVYQARQASLAREVALKMIKPRELDA